MSMNPFDEIAVEDVVRFKEAGAVTEVIAVSCDEPCYVTLPNIMKAKKKPLEVLTPEALGVDVSPRRKTLKVVEPAQRAAGVR